MMELCTYDHRAGRDIKHTYSGIECQCHESIPEYHLFLFSKYVQDVTQGPRPDINISDSIRVMKEGPFTGLRTLVGGSGGWIIFVRERMATRPIYHFVMRHMKLYKTAINKWRSSDE